MGGLAGIVSWDDQPVKASEINAMLARIRHRGPDGLTCQLFDRAGFGHALVALENNEHSGCGIAWVVDQSLVVVADARLYNRYDLAKDLGLARDTSAANLILHGYRRWGPALLDHLDGDYSFAVFNSQDHQVFAGRDIFGAKPFFFVALPNRFIFGSEPKQLLGFGGGVPAEPEPLEVARYLADQASAGENTIWKQIRRLRAGHYLVGTSKSIRQTAYWRPDLEPGRGLQSRADCIAEVKYLLTEAVARRLDATVPNALELSGGYDSSSVALLAAELSNAGRLHDGVRLAAISVIYPGFYTDESAYIGAVSERLPYPALRFEAPLDTTNIDLAEECWKLDSPAVFVETGRDQREAELVRLSGTRVLVTGFGGDDLFWEPNHGPDLLLSREFRLFWQWYSAVNPILAELFAWSSACAALRDIVLASLRSLYRKLRNLFASRKRIDVLNWNMHDLLDHNPIRSAYPAPDIENLASKEIFRWLTSARLNSYIELIETVRSYQGLELRYPFLDRKLAEFILAIPTRLRAPFQGRMKPLLQDAMEDLLPRCVLKRNDKATFDPYYIRLLEEWIERSIDFSSGDNLLGNSYLRKSISGKQSNCDFVKRSKLWSEVRPIWCTITLQTWLAGINRYGLGFT